MNAVLSLLFSASVLAAAIPDLFSPFVGQREPLRVISADLFLTAVFILAIVRFACFYDRLWLGFVLAGGFLGLLDGSFPQLVALAISEIRIAEVITWSGATIVSAWLTRTAFRLARRESSMGAQGSG
jgi:hypothetical protein